MRGVNPARLPSVRTASSSAVLREFTIQGGRPHSTRSASPVTPEEAGTPSPHGVVHSATVARTSGTAAGARS